MKNKDTKTKLLVAEDDNFNFILVQAMLKNLDIEIIRSLNAELAVESLKNEERICAILMDIHFSGSKNAFEVIGLIKSDYPHIPVIAYTATYSDFEIQKIKDLGFDDYISKPVDKAVLIQKIKQHCKLENDL